MAAAENSTRGGIAGWFANRVGQPLEHVVGGPARLRVITLLACVAALDAADKATIGAVAAELKISFHITNLEIGWLVTASTLMGALLTLPIGALVDRLHRTRLLVVAVVLWSAALAWGGFLHSYVPLLLSRLALGAIVATSLPALASLAGDYFKPEERGRIFGYVMAGELVGVAFGFLISGNVAAVLSWRWSFWILSGLGFVLAWFIWKHLPEPARGGQSRIPKGATAVPGTKEDGADEQEQAGKKSSHHKKDQGTLQEQYRKRSIEPHDDLVLDDDPENMSLWQAVRYILSIRTYRSLVIASALGYFYFTGLRTFAVVFMRHRFQLGQALASNMSVGLGLGAILGVLLAGRYADRLVHHGHLTGRVLVAAIAYLAATVAFIPGLLVPTLWIAGPLLFIAAAGVGGANPAMQAARLDVMPSGLWGRATGVQATCRFALEAISPPLFGWVAGFFGSATSGISQVAGGTDSGGLQMTFLVLLAPFAAVGVLLLLRTRRTYVRDAATAMASEQAMHALHDKDNESDNDNDNDNDSDNNNKNA